MHFIQNSWFINNWSILLLLFVIGLALIAYMNNRVKLLKHALVSCFIMLFLNIALYVINPSLVSTSLSTNFNNYNTQEVEATQSSVLSNVIDMVLLIAKEKIED